MKILCEVTWVKDEQTEEGTPIYEKGMYWIMQWGMEYKTFEVEEGRMVAVNYSVAICSNYETGQVECFLPSQLRIIGKKID